MRRFLLVLLLAVAVPAPVRPAAAQEPAAGSSADADARYYFLIARRLENAGNAAEAIATLRKAIDLAPESAELRAELAGIYARQNEAMPALEAAEAALQLDPKNQEANRILGSIYAALSEQRRPLRPGDDPSQYLSRAIAALEIARGSGGDLGLEFALGRLQLRAGRHQDAIVSLTRVFTQQPEYSEGGLLLAAAQESAGQVDAAIATLEATLDANPTFFRGYLQLIELYEGQRRWREAADTYASARQLNPKADLAGAHGAALLNAGDAKGAREVVTAAIAQRQNPDAGLLYLLAEAQRRSGDLAGVAATAERLRTAFPGDLRADLVTAQLHVAEGRTTEAVAAYADLVKRLPDDTSLVFQYAHLLEEADRVADAEKVLRDLLARDPMDADALNSLGYMFADRGERLDEAVELLQRALKIQPGNPSFLDSLGWAYFKQGRLELADPPLTEAAGKLPDNSVIQDHLGDLRMRQGRVDDAIVAWQRALAGDGESIDRPAVEKKLREARARVGK